MYVYSTIQQFRDELLLPFLETSRALEAEKIVTASRAPRLMRELHEQLVETGSERFDERGNPVTLPVIRGAVQLAADSLFERTGHIWNESNDFLIASLFDPLTVNDIPGILTSTFVYQC